MSSRTYRALIGSATVIAQNIIGIFFQLIITPMILVNSGQETLGGYAIIMQVIGYGILLDFGFSVALTRYLCQAFDQSYNQGRFADLLTIGRTILSVTNIIIAAMLLCAAWNVDILLKSSSPVQSEAQLALIMMAVWTVIRNPLYIYSFALTATQDLAALNIIGIGTNLIRLLAALGFTHAGLGLPGLVGATIVAELTANIVQKILFSSRHSCYKAKRHMKNMSLAKEMLQFGLKYWGVNLSVVLLLGSDNLIAGALFGAGAASIFYSTKMLGSLAITFISRIIDHAYPGINELVGKQELPSVVHVYLRLLRYVFLLALPGSLGIILFTRPLVTLWVGETQYAGEVMAMAVGLFVFVQVISHLHGLLALALGNIRHWSTVSIASGLLSVTLGYAMGHFLGMQWLLVGMTIAMLPNCLFLIRRVITGLDISLRSLLRNVFLAMGACLPLLPFMLLVRYINIQPTILVLSEHIILYAILWILGAWLVGLTQAEKSLITRYVRLSV